MFIQREQNLEQTKTYDQWHRARRRKTASNLPLAVVKRINLSLVRYFTLVFPVNKQNVSLFQHWCCCNEIYFVAYLCIWIVIILGNGKLCILQTSLFSCWQVVRIRNRCKRIRYSARVVHYTASKPQRRQQAIHARNPVTPVCGRGQEGSQLGKRWSMNMQRRAWRDRSPCYVYPAPHTRRHPLQMICGAFVMRFIILSCQR